MSTTWHVDDELLARYGRAPREVDLASAASTEAHLVTCARCRAQVAAAATSPPAVDDLALVWADVVDRLDQPRRTVVERLLHLVGLPDHVARLVGATAALQVAWIGAVALVVALVVLAVRNGVPDEVFVVVAPLVPLGAVGVSFARVSEPGGEAAFAAPISATRRMLHRAVAVLTASAVCLGVGAAALPGLSVGAAAWVLPSLALALATLAGATWRPVEHVAVALAGLWVLAVSIVQLAGGLERSVDLVLLGPAGQGVALAVVLAAAVVLVLRRHRLATNIGGFS